MDLSVLQQGPGCDDHQKICDCCHEAGSLFTLMVWQAKLAIVNITINTHTHQLEIQIGSVVPTYLMWI